MAIDFPTSPTVGQQVTSGSRTWSWSGSHWTNNTITGVQGLQGIQGVQGTQGTQGTQGIQGLQGITGTQGAVGSQGTQGTQGLQGIQGISGASILGLNNTFTGINSININGTVGATTPSTGAFTSLAVTGNGSFTATQPTLSLVATGGTNSSNLVFTPAAGYDAIISTSVASKLIFKYNSTEVARIDSGSFAITGALSCTTGANFATSSGSVGIGTTSPTTQLEVYKLLASNTTLQSLLTLNSDFGSAAGTGFGSAIVFRGRTVGNLMQDNAKIAGYNPDANDNGYALGFFTAPGAGQMTERLTISRAGNVGIGTASPARLLSISGGASTAYLQLCNTATGITSGNGLELIMDSAGLDATITNRENGYLALETNGTERLRLTSTGAAITGTLSATGQITSTVASGTVTLESTAPYGTGYKAIRLGNTGSTLTVGIESSAGGSLLTSATGYAGVVSSNSTILQLGASNTIVATLSSGAAAITGTLSATGDVTFGTTRLITDASRTTIMGALELNYSGGVATVQGYDRTGAAYKTLNLSGSTVAMVVNGGGTATFTTSGMYTAVGTANGLIGLGGITSSYPAIRYNSATEVGFVIADQSAYCATRATAFNVSSDRRIKTNIRNYNESGAMIDAIVPRIYDMDTSRKMHENGKTNQIGFIAQELYPVFEQAVTKGDDNEEIIEEWGIDYSKLVPVLVAELQSLRKRLAALEANQ